MESQEQQNDEQDLGQGPGFPTSPEEMKMPNFGPDAYMFIHPAPVWSGDGYTPKVLQKDELLERHEELLHEGYCKTICDLALLNALWRPEGETEPSAWSKFGPEKLEDLVHSLRAQLFDHEAKIDQKDVAFVQSPQFLETTSKLYGYLWSDMHSAELPDDIFPQAGYNPYDVAVP
jgi:hypothetical protein